MYCYNKRTFLNIWEIAKCDRCPFFVSDEQIVIGNKTIGIYHIFSGCKLLKEINDDSIAFSSKLRLLMKDAIIYQKEIFLFFIEDFSLNDYLDVFSKILDAGFHVQIITF
ncbi:MAG: hypothetical protein AB7V00_00975 [Bacilli bacterium]